MNLHLCDLCKHPLDTVFYLSINGAVEGWQKEFKTYDVCPDCIAAIKKAMENRTKKLSDVMLHTEQED